MTFPAQHCFMLFCCSCRRFAANVRGAAAVEFALISPVLVLIVAGLLQFGLVLYVTNEMTFVARDTARRMSTGEFTTIEQATTHAKQGISSVFGTLEVTATFPSGSSESPTVAVTLSLPIKSVIVADPFNLFETSMLTAEAAMRKE